ncbi:MULTISPECIES: pentapeptide repeat-containing protein [unclassified Nostoc]|uniref:pentapeptide repeat-containing protein n=1 Tax=unclassified Nostoc TaxID=2593658 RepID=UPI0025EC48B9|nr:MULTISPECIES: pentapeptide repeat-containing protein [unclassified Nostoc]
MNSRLSDACGGLRLRTAGSKLDSSRTQFGLKRKTDYHFWTNILSLFLWGIIGITATLGFAPTALALEYNKEILVEADFSGRDLTDSSFTKANLRQSNFSHANLNGVSFFAANLESANLESSDLRNSTLDSARLVRANLTNALLEGAFAANARFDGAIIDGADFTDTLLRSDEQKKLCKLAKGTNPITGRETRDTLFCP